MSVGTMSVVAPIAAACDAVSSRRSRRRPASTTAYPARASASATPRPMPLPAPVTSATRGMSVREAVDQVIDAELVGLVGLIERAKAAAGPLPELRYVGVVVDDRHQPLGSIVVLEDALEDRIAADIRLREVVEIVDLEKRVEHWIARHH